MAGGANLCSKPESRFKITKGRAVLGPLPPSDFCEVICVEEHAVCFALQAPAQ